MLRVRPWLVGLAVLALALTTSIAQKTPSRADKRQFANPKEIYKSDVQFLRSSKQVDEGPQQILNVTARDVVAYIADVPFEDLQSTFEITSSAPRPLILVVGIGDIREINGIPVGGTYTVRATPIVTTPTPSPETGFSIADSTRLAHLDHALEIFQEDGTPIGSIFAFGLGFGPPTPGAPPGAGAGSLALIGGTGAYLGMGGQMNTAPPEAEPSLRFASSAEHPAARRINGGGTTKLVLHLIPKFAPQVVRLSIPGRDAEIPAIFHATDQALVTPQDPAEPGEVLIALVRNLGPTNPGVPPGAPFPRNPVPIANSPVNVHLNGDSAEVLFAGGQPGAVDVFEVEFVVPAGASAGRHNLVVEAGFVRGSPSPIQVQ